MAGGRHFMRYLMLAMALAAGTARAIPQVESWYTADAGTYARIYPTTNSLALNAPVTTWSRGSVTQAAPAYAGIQAIYSSTNWTYVRSTGLAGYPMGPWYLDAARSNLFPNLPKNQSLLWRFPLNVTTSATKTLTGLGAIGLFVDGVAMFDSRDGQYWNGSTEVAGAGTAYWNRDAYVNEGITFDPGNAHQEQSGTYHYHANPPGLRHRLGDQVDFNPATGVYTESTNAPTRHSPILGWVRDGSPIYGPFGYADATNPAGGLARMRSGYQLRDGSRGTDNLAATGRTNLPDWAVRLYAVAANVLTGPLVSVTHPLGRYMEDNAFLGDLGFTAGVDYDLDEHNGRYGVTPEFPAGVYAYFVSIASNGVPRYPYNIGRAFHGVTAGGSVTSVGEPVTTNYIGGADTPPATAIAAAPLLTLTWSAVEGGTYLVESSTNLQSWSPVVTNASPITNLGTLAVSGDAPTYYRVTRVAVSNYDAGAAVATGGGIGIVSINPTSGARGNAVPFTLTLDATAPPQAAPIISLTIGTNVIAGAVHVSQSSVTGTFTIGAGAATGPQDIVLIWPGPPGNPTARVTNSLPGGFTVN